MGNKKQTNPIQVRISMTSFNENVRETFDLVNVTNVGYARKSILLEEGESSISLQISQYQSVDNLGKTRSGRHRFKCHPQPFVSEDWGLSEKFDNRSPHAAVPFLCETELHAADSKSPMNCFLDQAFVVVRNVIPEKTSARQGAYFFPEFRGCSPQKIHVPCK